MKATDSILTKQNDEYQLARSVNTILHVIQDFTPYACRRELENRLYDFFEKDEIELNVAGVLVPVILLNIVLAAAFVAV